MLEQFLCLYVLSRQITDEEKKQITSNTKQTATRYRLTRAKPNNQKTQPKNVACESFTKKGYFNIYDPTNFNSFPCTFCVYGYVVTHRSHVLTPWKARYKICMSAWKTFFMYTADCFSVCLLFFCSVCFILFFPTRTFYSYGFCLCETSAFVTYFNGGELSSRAFLSYLPFCYHNLDVLIQNNMFGVNIFRYRVEI